MFRGLVRGVVLSQCFASRIIRREMQGRPYECRLSRASCPHVCIRDSEFSISTEPRFLLDGCGVGKLVPAA